MSVAEELVWTLGDRMAKARRHAGLEQSDLADALGVSRPLVSKWEHDLREPTAKQVLRWAEVTAVPAAWLLGISPSRWTASADLIDVSDPDPDAQPSLPFPPALVLTVSTNGHRRS